MPSPSSSPSSSSPSSSPSPSTDGAVVSSPFGGGRRHGRMRWVDRRREDARVVGGDGPGIEWEHFEERPFILRGEPVRCGCRRREGSCRADPAIDSEMTRCGSAGCPLANLDLPPKPDIDVDTPSYYPRNAYRLFPRFAIVGEVERFEDELQYRPDALRRVCDSLPSCAGFGSDGTIFRTVRGVVPLSQDDADGIYETVGAWVKVGVPS
ncbi:MAG: hypothetical protein WC483_00630 [Candidatus Paceibacterota bacterium]